MVVVRQSGSTIATSVVSDAQGHYRFPRGRLAVGDYAVSIKAAGFDLDNAAPISIAASQSKIANLQLVKTKKVQKNTMVHELARPGRRQAAGARLHPLPAGLLDPHRRRVREVMPRMSGYPQLGISAQAATLGTPRVRSARPAP